MEIRSSGKAITSFVCGILSVLWPFGGIVLGVLGIVFGVLAKNEIRRSEHKLTGEGMATAGFVCGIIGVVISAIGIIILAIIGSKIKLFFPDILRVA